MQKGLTNIIPVQVLGSNPSPNPEDVREVFIFNNSGVNIWLGNDKESANALNGVPIVAGQDRIFKWNSELWIGADANNTEYRYIISPQINRAKAGGPTSTWRELGQATPPPPKYYNRPAGR